LVKPSYGLESNNNISFSLKDTIKYPDQALTSKLRGLALQSEYHFLLLLKSIEAKTSTGYIPFNSFSKGDVKRIVPVLGLKRSGFYACVNRLIQRGWLTKHKNSYNIKAINKINEELTFQLYQHKKEKFNYYSYRKLKNVQGIDLQAHRIYEVIKVTKNRYQYSIANHPQINSICSKVNQHLINSIAKNKVNRLTDYFGISIDTITDTSGYDSKKYVWSKINEMEKQGLKIKKSSTGVIIKGIEQHNCNLYDCSFEGNFIVTSTYVKPVKKIKPVPVRKSVMNQTETKFNNFLNSTGNRIVMIDANILSRNYLKFTKSGCLVKIPKRSWSNILSNLLSHDFFKPTIVNLLGQQNIKVSFENKKAMFVKFLNAEERFGSVTLTKISLHNSTGNYSNQILTTYKKELDLVNNNFKVWRYEQIPLI
jgi:hypothetical protein